VERGRNVRRHFFICFVLLILCYGHDAHADAELPPLIFKHWIHSYEEDSDQVMVFRPVGHEFPLSRGRDGFEIRRGGRFILHSFGPTDQSISIVGTWRVTGHLQIGVTFPKEKPSSRVLTILSVTEEILRVKQHVQ
jgi:hypothetical protein